MAAACTGEITRLIKGTATPPMPPRNPPFDKPVSITAGIATVENGRRRDFLERAGARRVERDELVLAEFLACSVLGDGEDIGPELELELRAHPSACDLRVDASVHGAQDVLGVKAPEAALAAPEMLSKHDALDVVDDDVGVLDQEPGDLLAGGRRGAKKAEISGRIGEIFGSWENIAHRNAPGAYFLQ